MGSIEEDIFVCIDCETTGLDPAKDQVIEIAVARFNLVGIIEQFESLINPQCLIPESSIAIHHITQNMVEGMPTIEQVLPRVMSLIGDLTIVGHGVAFDIELLALAAEKHGVSNRLRNNKTLDTLRMARHYGESPTNSLEQLRRHFNIQPEGAHRAMSDVMVNIEVFKFLAQRYKTTEQILDVLSRPVELKTMPLGKHKGRLLKEIPLDYLKWAAYKNFDQDLLFSIRSELRRRKHGNLFNQASNPFSKL